MRNRARLLSAQGTLDNLQGLGKQAQSGKSDGFGFEWGVG